MSTNGKRRRRMLALRRRSLSTVRATAVIAAVVLALPATAFGANVVNGNFETGDLRGWTAVDSGSGGWSAYTGTTSPESNFTVAAPPEGNFAAMTDQLGPGSHILYQDIFLRRGFRHTLNLTLYYANRASSFFTPASLSPFGGPNQQYRVDIVRPSAPVTSVAPSDVLTNVFQTNVGGPLTLDPTPMVADLTPFAARTTGLPLSVDLTPFGGQWIRLRLSQVDNQFYFQAAVDDVKVVTKLFCPWWLRDLPAC
jgi:hypothetical protein